MALHGRRRRPSSPPSPPPAPTLSPHPSDILTAGDEELQWWRQHLHAVAQRLLGAIAFPPPDDDSEEGRTNPEGEMICMSVGGKRFEISVRQLRKYPTSLFAALGGDEWPADDSGCFHIDRNPRAFETLLEFIRNDGQTNVVERARALGVSLADVVGEARFFMVPELLNRLEEEQEDRRQWEERKRELALLEKEVDRARAFLQKHHHHLSLLEVERHSLQQQIQFLHKQRQHHEESVQVYLENQRAGRRTRMGKKGSFFSSLLSLDPADDHDFSLLGPRGATEKLSKFRFFDGHQPSHSSSSSDVTADADEEEEMSNSRRRLSSIDMSERYHVNEWYDFEGESRHPLFSSSSSSPSSPGSPVGRRERRNERRSPTQKEAEKKKTEETVKVKTATEALDLLKQGNKRFLSQELSVSSSQNPENFLLKKLELHQGQSPHAIIISCSDSRAPPELVFDQGLGDVFVIRLAGNVLGSYARASILYALTKLHTPLVVVMGHQGCGAVSATIQAMKDNKVRSTLPRDLLELVTNIEEGIPASKLQNGAGMDEAVLCGCIANVEYQVDALHSDPDISQAIKENGTQVVGAYYMFNGAVTFL